MLTSEITNAVRGYGLAIYSDGQRDTCGFLDGSPVLSPARIEKDGDRRRLRFNEGNHEIRSLGDIFCGDMETAALVRQAVNEKFERDAEDVARSRFRIFGSDICSVEGEDILKLAATRLHDSQTISFDFVLQSKSTDRQTEGQRDFSRLCKAVNITEIEDADLLVGRIASFKELPGGSVDFRAAKAA